MMRQHLLIRETLRLLLAVLGVTALLIALSNLLLGPGFTAGTTERAFDAFTGWQGPSSAPWQPTIDNELRFYSALWGGYGIAMLATARNLDAYLRFVPSLAVVFFVGGVGRAISWVQVGAPHPLFLNLMAIELIVPPIFFAALRAGENGNNGEFEVSLDRRRGCIPPWRVARYGNQILILI